MRLIDDDDLIMLAVAYVHFQRPGSAPHRAELSTIIFVVLNWLPSRCLRFPCHDSLRRFARLDADPGDARTPFTIGLQAVAQSVGFSLYKMPRRYTQESPRLPRARRADSLKHFYWARRSRLSLGASFSISRRGHNTQGRAARHAATQASLGALFDGLYEHSANYFKNGARVLTR